MLLAPELINVEKQQPFDSNLIWSLSSQDQRIAHYLIEISTGDDVATLISEQKSSRLVIQQALYEAWLVENLSLIEKSTYKIDIQLIKLLAEVKQSSFSHQVNSNIVIRIQLSSDLKTFNKTFKSNFSSKSPLKANNAKISEQLNTQLSKVLTEIVHDPELNSKLQQF
jgi:uncharacterized lipoprotein